uniref:Uncharacterized protein n=1 Tax=Rhizophora mucronata TaxID=61149 RepID=A0A2P2IKI4_RHIMU
MVIKSYVNLGITLLYKKSGRSFPSIPNSLGGCGTILFHYNGQREGKRMRLLVSYCS